MVTSAKSRVTRKTSAVKSAVSAKRAPSKAARAPAKSPAKPPLKTAAKTPVKAKLSPQAKTAVKTAVKPVSKPVKVEKAKKPKMIRDSFTIPKTEYMVIDALKERAGKLSRAAKKKRALACRREGFGGHVRRCIFGSADGCAHHQNGQARRHQLIAGSCLLLRGSRVTEPSPQTLAVDHHAAGCGATTGSLCAAIYPCRQGQGVG